MNSNNVVVAVSKKWKKTSIASLWNDTSTNIASELRASNLSASVEALQDINAKFAGLRMESSPSQTFNKVASVDSKLFDATATVKIMTSQVAMHLTTEWRNKLFKQIDILHDPAEWPPEDEPIKGQSFHTFLKAIIQIKPTRGPGLAISDAGNLICSWSVGTDYLTIDFLPDDRVRWVASRHYDGEVERFAAHTNVSRLFETLRFLQPDYWFENDKKGAGST